MSNQNFRSPPVNVVHQNESQFHRPKGSGPNPLGCPPSLGHNQHQIPNNSQIQPILSNNSVPAGLAFNDLMQQPPNIRTGPPSATPQGPQIGYAANQQSSHFVNNLQGQLLSSLASQLMSQRSVMMNYDLSGNIPLLSRFGQHNHQNFQAGSNQSIVCLMDEKRASQGQDDLHQQNDSRQPDFTRIPCQARGMSTDHNALSAYLEIPTDAIHGLHLMCSHPACRSVGVKFRYCFYCRKPVTKQNFRSRHLHADLAEKERKEKPSAPGKDPFLAPTVARSGSGETVSRRQELSLTLTSSPPSSAHSRQGSISSIMENHSDASLSPKSDIQSLLGAVASLEPRDSHAESDGWRSTPQESRSCMPIWHTLLGERPSDITQLPGWISKVISCSDPGKHGEAAKEKGARIANCTDTESKWERLLLERPTGTQDDGKVTSWLVKVLEASSPEKLGNAVADYEGLIPRQGMNPSVSVDLVDKGAPPIRDAHTLQTYGDIEPTAKKRKV